MKFLIKKLVSRAVACDYLWRMLKATILKITRYAERERLRYEFSMQGPEIKKAIGAICPDLTVRHGPFQGMKYPRPESMGSSLFPKLLGSYEKEIQPIWEIICGNAYAEIVDIGCAEGYYAVGLALRIPGAKVFAYDTDQDAIQLCRNMAELNKVGRRVVTGGFCDGEILKSHLLSGKALIISDCEGYEKDLFSKEIVQRLAHHDVLVELHDFIDIEISSLIRRRFEDTHVIRAIQSVDDITKAHSYCYEELQDYTLSMRKLLLAECRPAIMEWFYMTPRID